jgi:uncharacterized protein (DUF2062 family)
MIPGKSFLEKRMIRPIVGLLKQGITPEKIALSLALGIVLGIFPVIGVTTLLCIAAAFLFKLNLPAIQLVNYLVYPLQLVLLLPFYRAGEWLFRAEHLPLSVKEILAMMDEDLWETILFLWETTANAMVVWVLLAPFMVLFLYGLIRLTILRLTLPSSPGKSGLRQRQGP